MVTKRRDNKNRVLKTGESQKNDGRYMYKYKTLKGETKYVYSWRLVLSDVTPSGKKDDIPLREKEKQIQRDLEEGIYSTDGNITVLQLVKRYVAQKTGVRHSTLAGYGTVINIIKNEAFGYRPINEVTLSEAKTWLIKLQKVDGRSFSSIHNIRGVVRPAFQMAVDDDLIRKNPFRFELATVIVNDSVTREAITRKQQRKFLQFVHDDPHFNQYYDAFYILFHTGLRISEFTGLTINDLDFENNIISVSHQLQRTMNMEYVIQKPKTKKGERYVPMTNDVRECFMRIIENRVKPKEEFEVDGYSGFLYLDKNNKPKVALHWEKYFERCRNKYNQIYREQLPIITPHVCRHTFCSNMARSGMNPKVLQKIMGHADISVTLDTYTHLDIEDIKNEMKTVCKNELKYKVANP